MGATARRRAVPAPGQRWAACTVPPRRQVPPLRALSVQYRDGPVLARRVKNIHVEGCPSARPPFPFLDSDRLPFARRGGDAGGRSAALRVRQELESAAGGRGALRLLSYPRPRPLATKQPRPASAPRTAGAPASRRGLGSPRRGARGAGARAGQGGASSLRAGALLRARPALLAPRLGGRRRPRPPAHSAELRGNGCGTPEACDPR